MSYPIKCIVLEDEPAWRRKLQQQLATFPEIELVGEAEGIEDAFSLIRRERPQTAFMDIKLVGGTAFQLIDRLERHHIKVPHIVMITGFPDYAVEVLNEYRKYVVKFLPKPMLHNWEQKLRDVIDTLLPLIQQEDDKGYFLIKTEKATERILYAELAWVAVHTNAKINVVTDRQVFQSNLTLAQFLREYSNAPIMQVSRTCAINIERIKRIVRNRETDEQGVVITYRDTEKFIDVGDAFWGELSGRL